MRRLPYVLAALPALLPLIACMQEASTNAEQAGADLADSTTAACNFAFQEVPQATAQPIARKSDSTIADGQALLFGDFTADGKADFLVANGAATVQLWQGDGAGHFAPKSVTTIGNDTGPLAGRTLTGLSTVATGDFDGDKKPDAVVIVTSVATPAAGAAVDKKTTDGTLVVLYGKGATADFDVFPQSKTGTILSSYDQLVADLDGDGKDDLITTSPHAEDIAFGSADRSLVPTDADWETTVARSLAYVTPKSTAGASSLLVAGSSKAATLTFNADRKPAVAQFVIPALSSNDSRSGTDLDQDRVPEVTTLGPNGLSITSLTHGKPIKFAGVSGHLVGAQDIDGDKSSELVYATTDGKLMAACGYSVTTNALAAVALPVPYPTGGFVAGQVDFDGDGHPNLLTMTSDGVLHAYRYTGKNATAPAVTVLTATVSATTDAGVTANATPDAAAPPAADGGAADAAAAPATDAGPAASSDAGSKPNSAGDGDSTEAPPSKEGSGRVTSTSGSTPAPPSNEPIPAAGEEPTTAPAKSTTSADSGCSTAPGGHAPLGFPALVLGAVVALVTRRRRR